MGRFKTALGTQDQLAELAGGTFAATGGGDAMGVFADKRRAQNLGIPHLYQGREDKLVVLDELLGQLNLSYEQVAYLGDLFIA